MLACLGCTVTAIERSLILAAMWRDALTRATAKPAQEAIREGHIKLLTGDAIDLLNRMSPEDAPDVVYLDPMYAPRGKTALPKKEMRILRRLVGDDPDAATLLATARRTARHRTVVKRTPRAQPLAPNPSIRYGSKLVRYDVYLRQSGSG
jgi:16S rRNA (guanine1516-N2)-methyltransferase